MPSPNLDGIDATILTLLAQKARMTNSELAAHIALSPSACLARVRRLEESGVILGYRAVIAKDPVGARLEGWAEVRLIDPTPAAVDGLEAVIASTEAIVEAHHVSGQFDYILRFLSASPSAWTDFNRKLFDTGWNVQSRFNVVLRTVK